jgi:hypothetical protein
MKRVFTSFVLVAFATAFVLWSCEKKNDSNSVAPCYKADCGTGANPNPNNVTTTGAVPPNNNEPTGNSSTVVNQGSGWLFTSCSTSTPIVTTSISALKGSEKVTLNFLITPTTGTYNVSSSLVGNSSVVVTVENANNQPGGIIWYGSGGQVSVVTGSTSIQATFIGTIPCRRQSSPFPNVNLSGSLGCF